MKDTQTFQPYEILILIVWRLKYKYILIKAGTYAEDLFRAKLKQLEALSILKQSTKLENFHSVSDGKQAFSRKKTKAG